MVPVSSCLWPSEVHDGREDTVNFSANPVEISAATHRRPPQHRHRSRDRAARAAAKPLGVAAAGQKGAVFFPAFLDLVRRQLRADYKESDLTEAGLTVFSTLDPLELDWTRVLPGAKTTPKNLLNVVDRPILSYIVEEARAGAESRERLVGIAHSMQLEPATVPEVIERLKLHPELVNGS